MREQARAMLRVIKDKVENDAIPEDIFNKLQEEVGERGYSESLLEDSCMLIASAETKEARLCLINGMLENLAEMDKDPLPLFVGCGAESRFRGFRDSSIRKASYKQLSLIALLSILSCIILGKDLNRNVLSRNVLSRNVLSRNVFGAAVVVCPADRKRRIRGISKN